LSPVAISAPREIVRRILVPLSTLVPISIRVQISTMESGIRSATPAIPRVSAGGAAPEALVAPASPRTTGGSPTAVGTLLARPGAHRRAHAPARDGLRGRGRLTAAPVSADRTSAVHTLADQVSAIRLSVGRVSATLRSDLLATPDSHRTHPSLETRTAVPSAASADLAIEALAAAGVGAGIAWEGSVGMATVGGEAFGPDTATVTDGARAFSEPTLAGDGEVGVSDWDGRTGVATGDRAGRLAGIPGGTTLIGMRRGRRTTTIRNILTGCTTIHRRTIPTLRVITNRQAIPSRLAWTPKPCT
jgi:hypothetical protein